MSSPSVFLAQPLSNGSIADTSDHYSAAIAMNPNFTSIVANVQINTVTAGTATFIIEGSLDGVNFFDLATTSGSLSAAGLTSFTNTGVNCPFIRLEWVGATSPNITGIYVNLYVS